ncbi:unnamed protein product [Nezara viridula]|uniref:Uncharacterized protein n=1 Tax=Nezara viridula TaxID=85310 RepID=A0A9P0H421_NEZVI|nr:unnamed protein product [Nezara viridula]
MACTEITIIHYNDVYNVEERAARFATAVKKFSYLDPIILFSGDALSPSMLSTTTKGAQMIPVLNEVGTSCAVFGNHEFDFGLEVLTQRISETTFPWLMSNVVDNETGKPLGDGKTFHIIDKCGKRIGLIGLVEREWLDTLATINPDELIFHDFVESGNKIGAQLKNDGCDYVIALTHMRMPNDVKLAECCNEIDLILGGHDHIYAVEKVNGKLIVKSGTDFFNFSKLTLDFSDSKDIQVIVEEIAVTEEYIDDPKLKEELNRYTSIIEERLDEVLGVFSVALDGRFERIRLGETNLGNWVCDVILAATGADLVILNSGTLRSDRIHPPGPFTLRDLMTVVPITDPLCVLELTGNEVIEALENGVSCYPRLEGRFPQVSGISFAFDPSLESGKRVATDFIKVGDQYLQPVTKYRVATKSYLKQGCDGYTMMKSAKVLVDEESCPELGIVIQNHFEAIKMRLGKCRRVSKHRQSLVTLSRRHSLVKCLDAGDLDGPHPLRKGNIKNIKCNSLTRRASLDDLERPNCLLAPTVDDRILKLDKEVLEKLKSEKLKLEAEVTIEEETEPTSKNLIS